MKNQANVEDLAENVPYSEIYVVVDKWDPDLKLSFERIDLSQKGEDFEVDISREGEFLLSNILPKRIGKITVSYSNNFCLHFVGFFTPMQKSKFDYYPRSGVYHLQNYGYRFENLGDILDLLRHRQTRGSLTFRNQFVNESDEDIYFLVFCPFRNLGVDYTFDAKIQYFFEYSLDRRTPSNSQRPSFSSSLPKPG